MTSPSVPAHIEHGAFLIFPTGTDPQALDIKPGESPDDTLGHMSVRDPGVLTVDSPADLSAEQRAMVREPQFLPPGFELDRVHVIAFPDGRPFQTTLVYFRDTNEGRELEDADLFVTRTLSMQPPVIVVEPGTDRLGEGIRAWTITPMSVSGHPAIYHDFTNNAQASRVEQQSDGIQWFDDEGIFNAVIGWDLPSDDITRIATSTAP